VVTDSRWIALEGAVNARDLGGLPAAGSARTRRNRLIRSDNLQGLTPSDVRALLDEYELRAVADLRTGVEVTAEGPGPLTHEPDVRIVHLSLFPEAGELTDAAAVEDDGPVVLPWQRDRPARDEPDEPDTQPSAAAIYLGYLAQRPDSGVAALRLIASSSGATIVHCAAGKDRTGVITALTLAELGVDREAIIDDYAMSAERIEPIFARLRASPTYAEDLVGASIDRHRPRPETMRDLLDGLDDLHGGAGAWLRAHGWSEADAAALRTHLLD
jgi:hypothetical protein